MRKVVIVVAAVVLAVAVAGCGRTESVNPSSAARSDASAYRTQAQRLSALLSLDSDRAGATAAPEPKSDVQFKDLVNGRVFAMVSDVSTETVTIDVCRLYRSLAVSTSSSFTSTVVGNRTKYQQTMPVDRDKPTVAVFDSGAFEMPVDSNAMPMQALTWAEFVEQWNSRPKNARVPAYFWVYFSSSGMTVTGLVQAQAQVPLH